MSAIKVDCIDEGGHLVRGDANLTEDEAREAVAAHFIEMALHNPCADCFLGTADEAREYALSLRCDLSLYRKQPCTCGEGHSWDMPGVVAALRLMASCDPRRASALLEIVELAMDLREVTA